MSFIKCHQNIASILILIVLLIVGCASQVNDDSASESGGGNAATESENKVTTTEMADAAKDVSAADNAGAEQNTEAGKLLDTGEKEKREDGSSAMSVESGSEGASVSAKVKPDESIEKYNALAGKIVGGKKLSIPKITGSVNPRNDEFHDTKANAITVLQDPTLAMKDFPRDRRMEVDWVKTLDQGHIEPRADLLGQSKMTVMDKDILMKNTQFMPWVKFPHLQHTKWLACENCHPKIFIPKEDANPISMNKVLRGEYCGVCHDKVAFALFVCERCHSVPHKGSGPKWW